MTSKHTPGPWGTSLGLDKNGNPETYVNAIDADGFPSTLAVVHQFDDDREANARLIATTPLLLKTLQDVLLAHQYDGALTTGSARLSRAIKGQVERAIALATTGKEA